MVARTGLFVKPLPGSPAQGTSPTDGRLVLAGLFGPTAGCIAGGTFTASATLMQITLGSTVWRIPDPTNSGAAFFSAGDPNTFAFSAGPASGSRKDVLWVKQNNYENSDADSRLTYGIQAGIAASPGTEPAITTAGAMKIGVLTVPAGVTNAAACTFTPTYPATVTPPFVAATTKALLTTISGQFVGQRGFCGDGIEYRWNGGNWQAWESDWIGYTPSLSGPLGTLNATNPGFSFTVARYRYTSSKIRVQVGLILNGSSAAMVAQLNIGLPKNPAVAGRIQAPGQCKGFDVSAGIEYYLAYSVDVGGSPILYTTVLSGTNGTTSVTGPNAPFTWAQNDQVDLTLEYDPA